MPVSGEIGIAVGVTIDQQGQSWCPAAACPWSDKVVLEPELICKCCYLNSGRRSAKSNGHGRWCHDCRYGFISASSAAGISWISYGIFRIGILFHYTEQLELMPQARQFRLRA